MKKLNQDDKASAIRNAVLHSGKPFLGIWACNSFLKPASKMSETTGLNILKGSVREFEVCQNHPREGSSYWL